MDNVEYILTCYKCYCLFYDKDESKFVCANCEEQESVKLKKRIPVKLVTQ